MAREIKFRGKFIYANADGSLKWIYGNLYQTDVLRNVGKAKIFETVTYGGDTVISGKEVILGTVGQFTGLHDKNGKEIYEGDIVRTDVSRANATKNKTYRNFAIRYDAPHFWNGYDTLLMSEWRMEVIGNIYDNPELLKEE